jgi:hypothetical protein
MVMVMVLVLVMVMVMVLIIPSMLASSGLAWKVIPAKRCCFRFLYHRAGAMISVLLKKFYEDVRSFERVIEEQKGA